MRLDEFYQTIEKEENQGKLQSVIDELCNAFPEIDLEIKWKQAMFMKDGCFLLAFSVSKHHFSVSPDKYALDNFANDINDLGYNLKKMLFSIKWTDDVDMDLLKRMIAFNIEDRKGSKTFWRAR